MVRSISSNPSDSRIYPPNLREPSLNAAREVRAGSGERTGALEARGELWENLGTVDGLLLPPSHRLGPLATIDVGNLRFEIGDDMRREGANVQKDHYHIHDMFQSPWIGAGAG